MMMIHLLHHTAELERQPRGGRQRPRLLQLTDDGDELVRRAPIVDQLCASIRA